MLRCTLVVNGPKLTWRCATLMSASGNGDDNLLRVAPLAAELARKPVNLLVVQGAAVPLVYELKLPAVYVFSGDPVIGGFANSLAYPGGNMTGLTFMAAEFATQSGHVGSPPSGRLGQAGCRILRSTGQIESRSHEIYSVSSKLRRLAGRQKCHCSFLS